MTDTSVTWAPAIPKELAGVVTRLQHCPSCGYSLEGLPQDHRCPECGEPYDASMREITTVMSPRLARLSYLSSVLILGYGLWDMGSSFVAGWLRIAGVGFSVGSAAFMAKLITAKQHQWYLNDRGIIAKRGTARTELIWAIVLEVRISRLRLLQPRLVARTMLIGKKLQGEYFFPVNATQSKCGSLCDYIAKYKEAANAHRERKGNDRDL